MNARRLFPLMLTLASVLLAQGQPAFEVASVKSANTDPRVPIGLFTWPGGRITATKLSLRQLIQVAYGVEPYQVSGGPAWMGTDEFDIEAVPGPTSIASKDMPASPKTPPSAEVRRMLQTLLSDRFKLNVRRQTGDGPVLKLTVGKGGPKLRPPAKPTDRPFVGSGRQGSPDKPATAYVISGQNASLSQLATVLAQRFKRPVLDETGLKGNFDFEFEYPADGDNSTLMSSLITAMQERLGLRLESTKGPVEVLLIEHVEKLSAN